MGGTAIALESAANGITLESLFALFKEIGEKQKATEKLLDKLSEDNARSRAEYEQKQAQWQAEYEQRQTRLDAQIEKTSKGIDKLEENLNAYTERNSKSIDKLEENLNAYTERNSKSIDKLEENLNAYSEKTSKNIDRLEKNIGGISNSLGSLIETLIAAKLWEKFDAYPYNLKRAYQRIPIYDEKSYVLTDIDILLSNTEWAMAVEVKTNMDRKDEVDRMLKRMTLIRKYPPAETVGKRLLGAMAGGVVDPDVRDYAHKNGFFVLELKGESVRLIEPPAGFQPAEW